MLENIAEFKELEKEVGHGEGGLSVDRRSEVWEYYGRGGGLQGCEQPYREVGLLTLVYFSRRPW